MPGVASLTAHQYYAHKRNGFWPIMLALVNQNVPDYAVHDQSEYQQKIDILQSAGFGLWDVLAECERAGSLDSAIKSSSVVMNDFVALFTHYTAIKTVAFNGKTAEKLFHQHVFPELTKAEFNTDAMKWICLPSSSPAMASLSLQQKYEQWSALLTEHTL